jgi:hypothetical protein
MAKELPYFKFEPNQWENGNIQMLSREDKGLFIDLCSMYWSRLGDVPLKLAVQKLCGGNAIAFDSLIKELIFEVIDDCICINFLNEQLAEFENTSKQNSKNAKERWEKVRSQRDKCERNASASKPQCENDAIREEKRREDKKVLLSEIEISDVEDSLKLYATIAKNFQEIIIKNLSDKNVSTKSVENAKFLNWVTPVRLMLENKECDIQDLRNVIKYLRSPKGDFWISNILSTEKLRKQIMTLIIKSKQ